MEDNYEVFDDFKPAKADDGISTFVKEKIENGQEASIFKAKVAELNPMESITDKSEQLKENAARMASRIFDSYGETITSRDEARRLVKQFSTLSSDSIAEMTSELESVINQEVIETGEKILVEYQEKLSKIDERATDKKLDFDTVDLIKGALSNIRENADAWSSDDFATETVEDVGNVTYEEKTYYEKVGQEEEKVVVKEEVVVEEPKEGQIEDIDIEDIPVEEFESELNKTYEVNGNDIKEVKEDAINVNVVNKDYQTKNKKKRKK